MPRSFSKAALEKLDAVKGKRARIVVEHLLKHGSITTDDLRLTYGYEHPPRAIKDVSDQGIPLKRRMTRKDNGRRMAEYEFGDLENIIAARAGGRANFPKPFKAALQKKYGGTCAICSTPFESRYLQIDHRIPYLVAGDRISSELDVKDYMLVCGPCNRAKSWSCEHCPNGIETKKAKTCAACYWANPLKYVHVATVAIRRLDLTWKGEETCDFDDAKALAGSGRGAMPEFVKEAVRRAVRGNRAGKLR